MTVTEAIKTWPYCPLKEYRVNPEKRCPKCKHKSHLKWEMFPEGCVSEYKWICTYTKRIEKRVKK